MIKNPLAFLCCVSTLDDGDFTQNKSNCIVLTRIHFDVVKEVTLLLQYFKNESMIFDCLTQ